MPLIMGLTVFYSALLIAMNLLVDAIYPIINPRLRK
jgi:ABC-type dipeptide/oligopeptide/nickel transport system permease component